MSKLILTFTELTMKISLRIYLGSSYIGVAFPVLMYIILLDYELLIIEGNLVSSGRSRVAIGTFLPK